MKAFFKWIYDWATIIAASLVGLPDLMLQLLNLLAGVDIAPLVGADKALKIVTMVAIVKGVLAFLVSLRKPA